jgi:hypothetical protein
MHSVRLESAVEEFVTEAAALLHSEVAGGNEVPFEVETATARRHGTGPSLYCYRPLTAEYIAERGPALERLPTHGELARELAAYDGLDRYLAATGVEPGPTTRATRAARARIAIRAMLADVFAEQTDFELSPERLRGAIGRLQEAAHETVGGVTLVATLHGLTIGSPQVALTSGLTLAHPDVLQGLPEGASPPGPKEPAGHIVAVLSSEEQDHARAIEEGRAVLLDLLRSLRLFGDGRVTLGTLAWSRVGVGTWTPLALGAGGRPEGMLLVTPEQEDELRAFCNLVSRRAPEDNDLAWALRRFELGCDRDSPFEALTDHVLALRALLEPEGPSSGMLPGRLAALCATPDRRLALTQRTVRALALERAAVTGTAAEQAGARTLAEEISDHLRALLRDVICGHLDPDLSALADEILLEAHEAAAAEAAAAGAGEPGAEGPQEQVAPQEQLTSQEPIAPHEPLADAVAAVPAQPAPVAQAAHAEAELDDPELEADEPAGEGEALEDVAPQRRVTGRARASAEEVLGYPGEPEEILDLSV